ncbi:MAG: CapA family protein [Spirochaetales bacterium]|nr:CapA family protein [Spirochaetales bacterium]
MNIGSFRTLVCIFCLLAAAVPAAAENGKLDLTFAGDIMSHDVNYRTSDYNAVYDDVRDRLTHDDLSFGNLETPVVEDRPYSGFPFFNIHLDYARAAVNGGFDVFALANNHTRDQRETGMLKTLSSLILLREETKGGVWYSGVRGDPKKPFEPVAIERNGFKIGYLAVTEFLNDRQSVPYAHVVEYRNKAEAARFIDWVKTVAPRYDLFILSYHGDVEYKLTPDPGKREFFRALARAGVGIVWGHHPHVVQPYECVEADGVRRLVMYSMGNFVSGMGVYFVGGNPRAPRAFTADSFLLPVTVTRNDAGKADVTAGEPILITSFSAPNGDILVKRLEPLAAGGAPGRWLAYYRARLELMRKFLRDMPSSLKP